MAGPAATGAELIHYLDATTLAALMRAKQSNEHPECLKMAQGALSKK